MMSIAERFNPEIRPTQPFASLNEQAPFLELFMSVAPKPTPSLHYIESPPSHHRLW